MSVMFDKLSFVKRLEDAGNFSRPQAEALSDAFRQAMSETVVTTQDLTATRIELEKSIDSVRTDLQVMRTDVQAVRSELKFEAGLIRNEVEAAVAETRVWTVSVGATIIAVLAAMKYFG